MCRVFAVVLATFFASFCAASATPTKAVVDTSNARAPLAEDTDVAGALAVVDAWLEATQIYDEVPGISVGIVHDQELVWAKGYGSSNLETNVEADADTIYSICSISKLFTSIGIMQLRDQGKLGLADEVEKHLDWFDIQRVHEGSPAVTIESLLTHSSGLPRESDFGYWAGPDFSFPTHEQMVERLNEQETLYASRERFQYSNLAMSLLGEILEARAETPYKDAVTRSILEPLGLKDTRPYYPEELRGHQLAVGYAGFDRRRERRPVKPFFTKAITPAAGFTSTVNDLAEFARWQFRLLDSESGGATREDTQVLAVNTLREMHRVHWVNPDWSVTWGLGFSVRRQGDNTLVGHGGSCPGYITQFLMSPKDKTAVIVLTNAGDGPASRLANGILEVISAPLQSASAASKALTDDDGRPKVDPAAADDSASQESRPDFSAYIGNYESHPWGGERAVRQWGDQLVTLGVPADSIGSPTKFEHVEGHVFVRLTKDGEKREQVIFELGEDGTADRMIVHGNPSQRIR